MAARERLDVDIVIVGVAWPIRWLTTFGLALGLQRAGGIGMPQIVEGDPGEPRYYQETASMLTPLPGARELLHRITDLGLQVVLATSAPEAKASCANDPR